MLIEQNELSHKNDFKNIAVKGTDEICILTFEEGKIGSYTFSYKNDSEYNKISKYTEVRAYTVGSISDFIYIFSLGLIFLYFYEQKTK